MREERLDQIAAMLRQYGKVEVSKLCQVFGVAEMTIRRDLSILAKRGIAERLHGGALLSSSSVFDAPPRELRAVDNINEKKLIAKKALSLLKNGQAVFFDSSTTVLFLAQLLTNEHHLVVVTDTIPTALELNSRSNIKVMCIGGELIKYTCSCFGFFAEQMISSMHFDIAFFSVPRISLNGVLSTPSSDEIPIKRAVMKRSSKVVLLVDHSKFADPYFLEQGTISDVDVIITDGNIPKKFLELCNKAGVKTILAR